MSHHYFNQTGILFKSATCPLRSQILRVTETNSLRILRGRHRGTRLRNCLDVKWLCRVIPRWLSSPGVALRNMMPGMTKLFMTQSLKIGVNLHSFVHTLLWCIDICHFAYSKLQWWCLVAPLWDQPSGIYQNVWQSGNFSIRRIAEGPDERRRRMQIFLFRNIVPK